KPLNDYQNSKEGSKQDSDHNGSKQDSKDQKQDSGSDNGSGKNDGLQLKENDVEKIRSLAQPIYKQGYRNSLVFAISCVFRRQRITKDSIITLIEKLARNDRNSKEIPDVKKAKEQVESVFEENIAIIAGTEHLKHVIYSIIGSRDKANEIFSKIFNI